MRGRILLGIVTAVGIAACSTGPRPTPGPQLGAEHITVVEFAVEPTVVSNYQGDATGFGLSLAQEIAVQLQKLGHNADAIPASGTPAGDVVVRGHILKLDGGSRALRYLVGFGAGAAKVNAGGQVTRGDDTQLATFSTGRGSAFGIFGGATDTLLQKCVRSVATDIAKMIHTGSYRQL